MVLLLVLTAFATGRFRIEQIVSDYGQPATDNYFTTRMRDQSYSNCLPQSRHTTYGRELLSEIRSHPSPFDALRAGELLENGSDICR